MKYFIFLFFTLFFLAAGSASSAPVIQNRQGQFTDTDGPSDPNVQLQVGPAQVFPADILKQLSPDQMRELFSEKSERPETVASLLLRKEILVPAIVFSIAPLIVLILAYFAYRNRRDLQETVRLAIQSGQPLPDNVMQALDKRSTPTTQGDLRKSILLLCLGVSGAIALFVSNREEPSIALLGLIPFVLGLGYLFLWWQASQVTGRTDHERA